MTDTNASLKACPTWITDELLDQLIQAVLAHTEVGLRNADDEPALRMHKAAVKADLVEALSRTLPESSEPTEEGLDALSDSRKPSLSSLGPPGFDPARRPMAALAQIELELRLSEQVFRQYGFLHLDKAEAARDDHKECNSRMQKAFRNTERADCCKRALDFFADHGGIDGYRPAIATERLLDWLARAPSLELSWCEIGDDLSECAWHVHRVNGGYNDREWEVISYAETPARALELARDKLRAGEAK